MKKKRKIKYRPNVLTIKLNAKYPNSYSRPFMKGKPGGKG